MGFAISCGILVAAFIMAMFFTPALTALIGHAAWWPGHGDERTGSGGSAAAEPPGRADEEVSAGV
jgi:RND superfamily putative drug exporter